MLLFRKYIDYDTELEEKVLGVFFNEPDTYSLVYGIIREECFYSKIASEIYKAIRYVYDQGYGIDYLVVQRYFFDKGQTEIYGENIPYIICRLMSGVCSSTHMQHWCIMLRELAAKRLMLQLKNSGSASGDIFEEAGVIESKLKEILDVRVADDWVHISKVGIKLAQHMEDMKGRMPGVSTSIESVDKINGGFRPGNLIVIGARPRVGKSAFMGRVAVRAAAKGYNIGIISLEMEDKDIMARSVSADSDIDFWRIDRNNFDYHEEEAQRTKVYNTIANLSSLPIHFSDTAQVNIHDIRAKAEKLRARKQLDMLIIDYLQLIESENPYGKNSFREQEIAKISRGLKLLAQSLKIPIIILAQLNRESEKATSKKPELHHLRESGSIEQDADVVFLLHRDYVSGIEVNELGQSTKNEADLLIKKWRNGEESNVKLGFNGPKMKFYDLQTEAPIVFSAPSKPNAGFKDRKLPPEKDEDTPF